MKLHVFIVREGVGRGERVRVCVCAYEYFCDHTIGGQVSRAVLLHVRGCIDNRTYDDTTCIQSIVVPV